MERCRRTHPKAHARRRCGRKATLKPGECRLPRPQSRPYGIPHLRASIGTGLATATEGIPTMQRIAERQEVKTRQRPRQPLGLQQPKHFSNSGGYFPRWRISREQSKHGRPNQCKRRSKVEDVLPTDGLSCEWSEKHRC